MYASAFVANLNARDGMRSRWAEVSSINVPDTLCEVPKTETLACVMAILFGRANQG